MCEPFSTTIWILACWLFLASVFVGLGLSVRRLFGIRAATADAVFLCFWTGWALALAILEVWHLGLAVDARALGLVVVLGAAGLAHNRATVRQLGGRVWKRKLFLGLALLLGLAVARQASGPLQYFDTGFYHLSYLEWIKSHPVVPGLGNLHGRLAFNSSFLLFAAMLDVGPWAEKSHYLANGLLMYVLLAQMLWTAYRFLVRRDVPRVYGLFSTLLIGPIVAQVLGGSLTSLSTDMPAFVLGIVISSQLLQIMTEPDPAKKEGVYRLAMLAALAAAGVAVKLSLAVYVALAAVLAFAFRGRFRALLWMTVCAGVVLLPWMAHGVYLSGYGLYPSTLLALPVDWRVPRPLVIDEARFIMGMARSTSDHWGELLGSWGWFDRWRRDLPASPERHLLLAALALSGLFLRRRQGPSRLSWLFFLPVVAALAWWFLTAPNPRFAGPLFAILAAACGAFCFGSDARRFRIRSDLAVAAVFFAVLAIPSYEAVNDDSYCESPQWPYAARTTQSGLDVYVPERGIQCWKIPLPCTPYFRPNLALRVEGDPSQGFLLEKTVTLADLEEGTIPLGFELSPDLGINLVSGWRRLDLAGNRRVMTRAGRFFVYTEKPVRARLRLLPSSVDLEGEVLEEAELRVLLDAEAVFRGRLRAGVAVEIDLPLERDFNDVVLEAAAERADGGDEWRIRRVAVAFESITITSL